MFRLSAKRAERNLAGVVRVTQESNTKCMLTRDRRRWWWTNNSAVIVALQPEITHSFRLAYVSCRRRALPVSDAATGRPGGKTPISTAFRTTGRRIFGAAIQLSWPAPRRYDGDGATNVQELLAGTDPTDPQSVLRARMITTLPRPPLGVEHGTRLHLPGSISKR